MTRYAALKSSYQNAKPRSIRASQCWLRLRDEMLVQIRRESRSDNKQAVFDGERSILRCANQIDGVSPVASETTQGTLNV